MINFTRAFDSAWERMTIILFQPFDLGKWFVIGFSAFLAGLLSGGNGVDFSYTPNGNGQQNQNHTGLYHHAQGLFAHAGGGQVNIALFSPFGPAQSPQAMAAAIGNVMGSLSSGIGILIVATVFVFVMGLILLFYWLGARGQFLLLDNIVRNRGAIAGPWSFYAGAANRVFGLYLICAGIGLAFAAMLAIPAVFIAFPLLHRHQWPQGPGLAVLIVLAVVYLLVALVFYTALFLFREWGVALMFRNGLPAGAAIAQTWQLLRAQTGSVVLFLLLRIALFVAMLVISNLLCCVTCCGERLPYLGTVLLLPAILYLRCFSLDVLAQFGPSCDVWTVDVPAVPVSEAGT